MTGLTAILIDPKGNQATTMSHTGRLEGKRGIGETKGERAKKGDKIGAHRV